MTTKKNGTGDGAVGMPRNCRGLFNWGTARNPRDLDESFASTDEYADEFRRLRGDVMPANEFAFGMHVRSASGAGVFLGD